MYINIIIYRWLDNYFISFFIIPIFSAESIDDIAINSDENIGIIKKNKKIYKNNYLAINKLLCLYIYR